jgi:hypothetical protein
VLTMYQSVMDGLSRALARARAPSGGGGGAAAVPDTSLVQPISKSDGLNLDPDYERTNVKDPRATGPGIQREDRW